MSLRTVLKASICFKSTSVFFPPALPPFTLFYRNNATQDFDINRFSLAEASAIRLWLVPLHLKTKFATLHSQNKPFLLGKLFPTNQCHCAILWQLLSPVDRMLYVWWVYAIHPLIDRPSDCRTLSSFFKKKYRNWTNTIRINSKKATYYANTTAFQQNTGGP